MREHQEPSYLLPYTYISVQPYRNIHKSTNSYTRMKMQQPLKYKTYFRDRDFIFHDSEKMDSFRLTSELSPQPQDSYQSLLLNFIIEAQAKNDEEKTLKAFFKDLHRTCASHIKEVQRRKGGIINHEDQKRLQQHIFYIFLREIVIFFSFLGSNTTEFSRNKGLYNDSSSEIFINCQKVSDRLKESQSKQETHQLNSKIANETRMQVSLSIKYSQTKLTQMRNVQQSKSLAQRTKVTEIEGQMIHDYFKQFVREEDRVSILKGHSNTFYIIDHRASLGKGGFGEVCRAQSIKWCKGGSIQTETWAIKSCKKNINQYKECGYSISQEREHQILMQINKITKKEEHKAGNNIISIKEVINQKNKKYIVYEYCPHNSLRELTKKGKRLTSKNVYEIAYQLAQVLKLVHMDLIKTQADFLNFSVHFQGDLELNEDIKNFKNLQIKADQPMGIIHRDLKLNNILVKEISPEHIVTKVIDWAFCKRTYTNLRINKVHCGTVHYQAPQIQAKEKYNSKVDIWALGAALFQLLTDRQFFDKNSTKNTKKQFKNVIKNMQFLECYKMSWQQKQFWQKMLEGTLHYEVDSRWSALELCNHFQTYKRYRAMEDHDYKELARLNFAKDCLYQHLGALEHQARRTKLTSLAFKGHAQTCTTAVDFLMVKLFKDKISLQNQHLQLLHALQSKQIKDLQEIPFKLYQSKVFFQDFAAKYPRLPQLLRCLQYLIKKCGG